MVGSRGDDKTVTCPACGRSLARKDAREYDKYGDRFDREGKTFEYFCPECHDELSLQDRSGLESLLTEIGAGDSSDVAFVRKYTAANEDPDSSIEER